MANSKLADLFLNRSGRVSIAHGTCQTPVNVLQAFDAELAQIGYVASHKLRFRLATQSPTELASLLSWLRRVLVEKAGGFQRHEPLFRSFPHGIPTDTFALWIQKFIGHFCQGEEMPCLTCGKEGTTHVLKPCHHVVCDQCFDGKSYSACPICEREVDRTSPFFQRAELRLPSRREWVTLQVLDLGDGDEVEARKLFESFCARKQALNPDDLEALTTIVQECSAVLLSWVPAEIPLRENVAHIYGSLLKGGNHDAVLAAAQEKGHLKTATDMLRVLAAFSGADPSLQGQDVTWQTKLSARDSRSKLPTKIRRFQVGKMPRAMRRSVLGFLDGLTFERLAEDMLRHQSYWVWLGQFLHPLEHAKRFPHAALAFSVVRETEQVDERVSAVLRAAAEECVPQDEHGFTFQTYYGRLDTASRSGDVRKYVRLLEERPGEFARRLDHALCLALTQGQPTQPVVDAFCRLAGKYATPVLTTLLGILPVRARDDRPKRIFWPKGQVSKGVSVEDTRPTLPTSVVEPLVAAIRAELLHRFGEKQQYGTGVVDLGLRTVVVPFNERTASRSAAVSLPRGSRLRTPVGKTQRLFLHWCQPEKDGHRTDLDLSVGLWGADWRLVTECTFYHLTTSGRHGKNLAVHSGDRQDAPHPDGATEFIDLDIDAARRAGIRYAVMVINAYSGMSFDQLERAYAGVMDRSDIEGLHFDPRTVTHKFALQGDNGVFYPLVWDLQEGEIHWLDFYASGASRFNTLASSEGGIAKVASETMAYFGSGQRVSIYELGLLHAAARCRTVFLRDGDRVARFTRSASEGVAEFHRRLVAGEADGVEREVPQLTESAFTCLLHGNMDVPEGSTSYALYREQQTAVIAASDLLS